jgi:sentrin-specific protease 1
LKRTFNHIAPCILLSYTIHSPRPPPPFVPAFEALRLSDSDRARQITKRIHARPKRKLPRSLPAEDAENVATLFARRSGVIAKAGKEQVAAEDIQRLKPGEWLNDEVINFFGQLIVERSELWAKGEWETKAGLKEGNGVNGVVNGVNGVKSGKGKGKAVVEKPEDQRNPLSIHYFSTFFFSKLENPGYEKARLNKWTKRVWEVL